jgi:hypothetical protein
MIPFLFSPEMPLQTRPTISVSEEGDYPLGNLCILVGEGTGLDVEYPFQIDRGMILITDEEHILILLKMLKILYSENRVVKKILEVFHLLIFFVGETDLMGVFNGIGLVHN